MPDNEDYVLAVAEYFLKKKGKGLMLSPGDSALLFKWESENIPIGAIIRGIDKAFSTLDQIWSLKSCRPFVEEELRKIPGFVVRHRREENESYKIRDIAKNLDKAASLFNEVSVPLSRASQRVLALSEFNETDGAFDVSDGLAIIELDLAEELLRFQDETEVEQVKRRIENSLRDTRFVSPAERLASINDTLLFWVLGKYGIDFTSV